MFVGIIAKVAKAVGSSAPKGEKKETERNFIDACESAGIIRTSDERFSIVSQ